MIKKKPIDLKPKKKATLKKDSLPKLVLGRPTKYTVEIADQICARIAEGESLVSICRSEQMPSTVSVYAWLRLHENFLNRYTIAREDQADTMADEMIEIADDGRNDWMMNNKGEVVFDREHAMRSRLRIETRKWAAAKLKPKKYGDFSRTEITGKDGKDLIPDRILQDDIKPN